MDFKDYQNAASRTLQCEMTRQELIGNLALGLTGESAEIAELIPNNFLSFFLMVMAGRIADFLKKVVYHKHHLDINKLEDELGDNLWYLCMIAEYYKLDMAKVAQKNLDKLKTRYPKGFDYDASRNNR